jgi:hypothetical protein
MCRPNERAREERAGLSRHLRKLCRL